MKRKKVIIGIDGAPYGLMDSFSENGVMPNFKELKSRGVFKNMMSSNPHISSVSWSSIITGKNPAEHGVFGFTELIPGTYSLAFPDFNWLKEPPFWQKDLSKKYVILNVPSTYPVKPMNGVHVSGFISLDMEKAVYPQDQIEGLEKMGYQIDVDSGLAHQSKSLFLERLKEINEARIEAYKYFWNKEDWDIFMLVFTGSDRLGHFFWDAYEDENNEYRQEFVNYFKRVDDVIGEIAGKLSEDDSLLLLSDHGMERIELNFYVNRLLKEKGFLDLDSSLKGYNQITKKTRAFALDPGRIYIHREGKYPNGCVSAKENEESVIKELERVFKDIEKDGKKVIKKIYKKEEIYHGSEIDKAPDLILIENSGFRLRGNIDKGVMFEKDVFTGDHSQEDAFLCVLSKNCKDVVPENPMVEDVEPILNKI